MTTKNAHVFYTQFLQGLSLLFSRHTVFVVTLPRRKHRVLSSSPYLPLPRDILSFRMNSFYKAPGTSSQEHTVFTTYSDSLLCHNTSVSQTPVFYINFDLSSPSTVFASTWAPLLEPGSVCTRFISKSIDVLSLNKNSGPLLCTRASPSLGRPPPHWPLAPRMAARSAP